MAWKEALAFTKDALHGAILGLTFIGLLVLGWDYLAARNRPAPVLVVERPNIQAPISYCHKGVAYLIFPGSGVTEERMWDGSLATCAENRRKTGS